MYNFHHTIRRLPLSYLLSLLLLFTCAVSAQDSGSSMDMLSAGLEKLSGNHVREEVYVQTAKDVFETSEDLWFKAYVLDAQSFTPSAVTQTLYVSLLQLPDKKVVWQEKYAVYNGFTNGHLYLQDTLQPGNYALVAQTGFSVDKDAAAISSFRKIEVIKDFTDIEQRHRPVTRNKENRPTDISFQLMPEGGHLVAGLINKLAYKAVDARGYPVPVKGALYDGTKHIVSFESMHAGMGSFFLTPHVGADYNIKLEGYTDSYSLPQIKPAGVVLQLLYQKDNQLVVKVAQTPGLAPQYMHIRLQTRGMAQSRADFTLSGERLVKIPLADVPQGIAELTLYNEALQPMAERLVFVNDNRRLNISAQADKKMYGDREKVKLKLTVTDENARPVMAHIGLGVSDALYADRKYSGNISSHYQLSAQIKGAVYDPAYYFDATNKNRLHALDLLLLTQGWRAYVWSEDNLAGQSVKNMPFVADVLTGSIYPKKKKANELMGQKVITSFLGNGEATSDFIEVSENGQFTVLPEYLQHTRRSNVYFKLMHDQREMGIRSVKDLAFSSINELLIQKELQYPLSLILKQPPAPIPEKRLKAARNVYQLREVVISKKVKKPRRFSDKYLGTLDSLAGQVDYVCHLNVLNCKNHPIRYKLPVEGQVYKNPDTDMLMPPYKYKHFTEEELLEKYNLAKLKGYYPEKEFYSPVYEPNDINLSDDFRNVLFWKPDVITDENGVAEIEFYTSDITSNFRVVAEGVSADGILGSSATEFLVEKKEQP